MSKSSTTLTRNLRVMFMGMGGAFSALALKSLLERDVEVCTVVTPGTAPTTPSSSGSIYLPLAEGAPSETILSLAQENAIPVEYVSELDHAPTLTRLATYQPQVVLVACFLYIFPPTLLQLPPRGCLNLHPSLLPAYRGPAPLFWQFRQGERRTGVTLHLMNERLDAGDILLQQPLSLPDGITGPEADALLAQGGGQLMAEALGLLEQDGLAPRVQNESEGSYYPWPAEQDFQISTDWSARRAFNFIRGTEEWGCAHEIIIKQERFAIQTALSYSAQHELGKPYTLIGRELWVQFSPGVLRTVVAHT
jgi:methionyl-tRNA formyltransferase